ncbi:MAG: AsmA-like C-terminal region-containing protein, partial [Opitutales bacterium]
PSSAVVRGVRYSRRGIAVRVDRIEADYSLFALVLGSRLKIDRLQVRGLELDARRLSRRTTEAGAAAAPVVTPGALGRVVLPFELVLDAVDIQGRAQLPGAAGKPAILADLQVTGGGVAPGREGTLHLRARLTDPSASARVGALEAQIDLQLRQSLQHTFDRIGLNARVEAAGPGLSGRDQLKLEAELVRTTSGENYRILLDTVRSGMAANLLTLNATVPAATRTYQGDWSLTARSDQLEPFFLGGALPRFDLRGRGRFLLNPAAEEASVQGDLQGDVAELEALQPALRAIGEVKFQGRLDLAVAQGIARLNQLELSVTGERPVLDLRASGAAAFNLKEHRLHLGGLAAGEVLRLKLLGVPLAWVRPFLTEVDVTGGALTGEIAVVNSDGSKLVVQTATPLQVAGLTVVRSGRTLLSQGALVLEAGGEITPTDATLRVTKLLLHTAAGDRVQAHGTVSAPIGANPVVAITAGGEADLPALLNPWLSGVHPQARGEIDLILHDSRLELRKFALETSDGQGRPLVTAAAAHPFGLDLRKRTVEAGAGGPVLATLRFAEMPLTALRHALPGFGISGVAGPGEFSLQGAGDRLILQPKGPMHLANVSLKRTSQPWLDNLSVELSPVMELTGGTVSRLASGDLVVRDAAGLELSRVTAELTLGPDGEQHGSLGFDANLAGLAQQPFLAGRDSLQAGRASGEIRTAFGGGARRVEARATLNGLVLREGNQALPVANLSLRADLQPGGRLSLQMPVLLDRSGVRSDLTLALEGTRNGPGINFDAKLSGEQVDLGDTLLLLGALGTPLAAEPGDAAAQSRSLSPPAADTSPFWTGLTGQVALDLKSVARGQEWTMSGLTGRLVVEPARLQLQKLEAGFGEKSRLAVHGELAFAPGPNPYALQGDFSLTEFDAGKLFKVLEPGRPPTIEGVFTIAGQAESQGLTLDDTIDRVRGHFQLTSRQGVFRGLKRSSDKLSVASKAVEWSAALGSMLGTDKVKQTAEKMAGPAYLVDQLGQMLGEFSYDQLSLQLVRDPSLNLQLQDVSLVSPEVRLLGSGQVAYTPGKPLLEQPLSLALTFAARGKIEQTLGKLHELDGSRDELGYAKTKNPVTISGSLAKPNPMPYFSKLAASKFTDFLLPDN